MFCKEKKDILINFRVSQSQKDVIDFMCKKTGEKKTDLIMRLLQVEYDKIVEKIE